MNDIFAPKNLDYFTVLAKKHLEFLCSVKPNRRTGSVGNREATSYFTKKIGNFGYKLDVNPFPSLDYQSGDSSLTSGNLSFSIKISPYSMGCDLKSELITVTSVEELENCVCDGKILLMKDEICIEQLMPKNFVFYNPDRHKKIYQLLEEKNPAGIITATKKNSELVGALYPFPLILDGDFDIPCAYCDEIVGEMIAKKTGETFNLKIETTRIPTTSCNVIATKNSNSKKKIVICAHIDAYEDTPGALDNASGTVVLLLLAEMLSHYDKDKRIEIIAFNGEDHYSAGGQMDYLERYGGKIDDIILVVNIDDVGYTKGGSSFSFYNCGNDLKQKITEIFSHYEGLIEGMQWYQGDHMIFVQKNVPSIAFTAENFKDLMEHVTHTAKDVPDLIECMKLVEIAGALKKIVESFFS